MSDKKKSVASSNPSALVAAAVPVPGSGEASRPIGMLDMRTTDMAQILYNLANPREYELDFDQEIRKSMLADSDPTKQMMNVVRAFNKDQKSIMVKSMFGKETLPGKYRITAKNNVPELVPPSTVPQRKIITPDPKDSTSELGFFDQQALFFGAHGRWVVNVPNGKVAKAWINNEPVFLGPGPHVIHDQNFKSVTDGDLVNYGDNLIRHGTYLIVRIPQMKFGRFTIKNTPYFLIHRDKPYVFKDPTAQLEDSSYLVDINVAYTNWGPYFIVRVQKSQIGLFWLDNLPLLLEARQEPYVFKSTNCRLMEWKSGTVFADTAANLIVHGPIKRILPQTGQVAITYNGGHLVTFEPKADGQPIIITSESHKFEKFIDTTIQTKQFPSEKRKQQRIKENQSSAHDTDYPDVNYEVYRTSDSLLIGVKLLVVYRITKPDITFISLAPEMIDHHIESLVSADMGLIIQQCSSVEFLKANQVAKQEDNNEPAGEFYANIREHVFKSLTEQFKKLGIELHRFNIETIKILDKKTAEEMSKFSILNTETQARATVIGKQTALAKQEAEQKASVRKIATDNENQTKISAAQADLEAAKVRQQAILAEAEARAKASILEADARSKARMSEAEAEAKAEQLRIQNMQRQAELFSQHPALLQSRMTELQAESMKGIQTNIISPDVAAAWYGMKLTDTAFVAKSVDRVKSGGKPN